MSAPYTAPQCEASAFNCPACEAYAAQSWGGLGATIFSTYTVQPGWRASVCHYCRKWAFWVDQGMVFPFSSSAPLPNPDMPADLRDDYEEARAILNRSPRGAAALLRLLIQKLCAELGEKGKSIDADIGSLVAKGLPPGV